MAYTKTLSLNLSAASANGIAQSQSKGSAGNLTLNGSLVSGGVATLDSNGNARRVLLTFAADETGHNFTLTGTGWNGAAQSEVIAGSTVSATSVKDYKTITQISVDAATTGALTAGTNQVASTPVWIVDPYTNASNVGCGLDVTGTESVTVELSLNYYAPAWDLNSVTPMWFPASNFTTKSADTGGVITEPFTMLRVTQVSGTGSFVASFLQPMISAA